MRFIVLVAGLLLSVVATSVTAQNAASFVGPSAVPGLAPLPATVPLGMHVGVPVPAGYEDGGRRDPFAALVAPKKLSVGATPLASRPRGLAGLALADVTIRGLAKKDGIWQAMLEGPNKQTYAVRANDKLLDAIVVSVDELGVVFAEESDAGVPAQRVRRVLRPAGEATR